MYFDLSLTLYWWTLIFLIGIIFLPLTSRFFSNFLDRGYIFSKIIGISILSYSIFLLGISHISAFTQINSIIIISLFFVINLIIFIKEKNRKKIFNNLPLLIFEEMLFLAGLIFWARVRAAEPNIHGLEKFMDFGFINSILRADYFPPKDMWFTPLTINYYYFGHLTTAVLTKISGISSSITFNLMMSTDFALCLVGSFSLGINLVQKIFKKSKLKIITSGILTAFLVTLSGNLHTIYTFFKEYNPENMAPIWNLPFQPFSFPNSYWYPNATRFIFHTIHEFPIYSWVVADLHGHVLDIPVVLLTLALFFSLFIDRLKKKKLLLNLFFVGFLLSIMYMTNAWDGIIYFLLALMLVAFFFLETRNWRENLLNVGIIVVSFMIFVFPFNFFFKPFVSGIGVLCAPEFLIRIGKIGPFLFEADHCQVSAFWQLAILYGFFYFFVFSFLIFLLKRKKHHQEDLFIVFLITLSTLLIIFPEFIYAKDIYPAHFRANTMFKMVYQAFIMLSLSSGYIISRLLPEIRRNFNFQTAFLKSLWILIFLLLFSLVSIYPYFAINSYYNGLKNYKGLDGTTYLKSSYPNDFSAIVWINQNIKGQPVILEAQGDSYTDFARVSANTGLPTVLGWTVHEWLWRGTYDVPAPRINEIKSIYESEDIRVTKNLIKKYDVSFIFIGDLESQKYKIRESKFEQIGDLIFQKGKTKIYQVNHSKL